jgi:hypothetical protein
MTEFEGRLQRFGWRRGFIPGSCDRCGKYLGFHGKIWKWGETWLKCPPQTYGEIVEDANMGPVDPDSASQRIAVALLRKGYVGGGSECSFAKIFGERVAKNPKAFMQEAFGE